MSFRVSDLVTNLDSVIPLGASCTAGYSNVKPCSPTPPSPPANPTQDFYPTRVALGSEALPSLRRQLRRSLWMQPN